VSQGPIDGTLLVERGVHHTRIRPFRWLSGPLAGRAVRGLWYVTFRGDVVVPQRAKEAVQSVQELIDALAAARAEMRRAEQSLKRALERCAADTGLDWLINVRQPATKRQALADALEAVNQGRHKARLAMFALAHEEGYSDADIGRAWGISRQLASRFVREATRLNENAAADDDGSVSLV
jgi:hypothetical protein